ncbi:MAG: hypothetical protein HS108_04855 [Planctomycetes bacterium]|nr:hypothetical protein [Planctomycetota bacterium]
MPVSSPVSTGGGGTAFEFHANAAMLLFLLIGRTPPFAAKGRLVEVHLQCGHLGWSTDDLLLKVDDGEPTQQHVLIQVKKAFSLIPSDDDCVATFGRAFRDFKNANFRRSRDRIALIVQRGSETFLKGTRSLLDHARSSLSTEDFLHRLDLTGFLPKEARNYYGTISDILTTANGGLVPDTELRDFLRAFDFVVLDLAVEPSAMETMLIALLEAHRTEGSDSARTAWNELVTLATQSAQTAKSFRREDLPDSLQRSYAPMPNERRTAAAKLTDDSEIVVQGVKIAINGSLTLPRAIHVQAVLATLEADSVALVTGDAGSGKSAVARFAFDAMAEGSLGLAFRAERFAEGHVNDALRPYGVSIQELEQAYSLHPRRVIWIESVERLLEKSTREAFADLLRHLKKHPGWKLLVTCRSHAAENVKSALLTESGLSFQEVQVPLLNDRELDELAQSIPVLQRPLSIPNLRPLMKNPFWIDKAAQLNWADTATLPETAFAFRSKVWHELVRRDSEAAGGMPARRGAVFEEVCKRRAVNLEQFVRSERADADVVQKLLGDGLLASPDGGGTLVAPSHDVLEDWALLHWLDDLYLQYTNSPPQFFEAVGTSPALRRAYRVWLVDRLNRAENPFDSQALRWLQDTSLERHWRDDTIVGILLSEPGGKFIERNKAVFLRDGLRLLRVAVHLLRVACKRSLGSKHSYFQVPVGSAWHVVPGLLAEGIDQLRPTDSNFVLGFLEDWCALTVLGQRYPGGVEAVVKLALRFLPSRDRRDRDTRDLRRACLRVLMSVPKAAEGSLRAMVKEAIEDPYGRRIEDDLLADIWSSSSGSIVCRDLPDLTLEVANYLLQPTGEGLEHYRRSGHLEIDALFGLNHDMHHACFPSSAVQGPFWNLLTVHPERGLKFVLSLLNRSAQHYAEHPDPRGYVVPPREIELRCPDGTKLRQWANDLLWGLYRAISVGPDVLQSALMALEKWLLLLGDAKDTTLPARLMEVLKGSNNVAATAVVASVCLAHPRLCGEAGLVVLSHRALFQMDYSRWAHDHRGQLDILTGLNRDHALHEADREISAQLPHRKHVLSGLVVLLQQTNMSEAVCHLIDDYVAEANADHSQSEDSIFWKKQLHEMDFRNFEVAERIDETTVALRPSAPPEDVAAVVNRDRPHVEHFERLGKLWVWAADQGEISDRPRKHDGSDWGTVLREAMQLRNAAVPPGPLNMMHDPEAYFMVASVCVLEHWNELDHVQRSWCIEQVCLANESMEGQWLHASVRAPVLLGRKPISRAVAKAAALSQGEAWRDRVLRCLAIALTHSEREPVFETAMGVAEHLWPVDRKVGLACLNVVEEHRKAVEDITTRMLAWEHSESFRASAGIVEEDDDGTVSSDSQGGESSSAARPVTEAEASAAIRRVRDLLTNGDEMPEATVVTLDPTDKVKHRAALCAIRVLMNNPSDALALPLMKHLVEVICACWDEDQQRERRRRSESRLSLQLQHSLFAALTYFAVRQSEAVAVGLLSPLIERLEHETEQIADLLKAWIHAQDRTAPSVAFWSVWQSLADKYLQIDPARAKWNHFNDLLGGLFLGVEWKADARKWEPLVGYEERLADFFRRLPASSSALAHYSMLLAKVGATALPGAIVDVAQKVNAAGPTVLSRGAQFYLETVLLRLIYGGNVEIRANPTIRGAAIDLLNALVDFGSSAAFKLRDDLLTPFRNA